MTQATDIYLNCNASNLMFAQGLKKDLESKSRLSITIENDDWDSDDESESSCEFLENIDMAKQMIIIHAADTTLTAWVMDPNFRNGRGVVSTVPKPQKVFFDKSYKAGVDSILNLIKLNKKSVRRSRVSSLWKQTKSATSGIVLLVVAVLFAR